MSFLSRIALGSTSALFIACQVTTHVQPGEVQRTDSRGAYEKTIAGLEHHAGLFTVHLDKRAARVWFELPADGFECLYVEGLRRGLGSNDVGLDRGQLGATRVVRFRRVGDRVLLEAPNLDFRSSSADAEAERAAQDSFASSILWAGEVAAETPDGGWIFDATSLVVRDAHGSQGSLKASGGSWSLDEARSVLLGEEALVFPDNIELEALLTFAGEGASREIREVTPDSQSVTLVQHHSFVRLPDDEYERVVWNEARGGFARTYVDVSAGVGEDNVKRFAVRHRLQLDLESGKNESGDYGVIEPIVYYVDRGAPEPVRSALVKGASWWSEAFEAAGAHDAFRVELLPEGVHPLDVRYNVIQWVHRSSRGWSYGGGVTDPRSGEMIKGHVTLGSLRVRQDRMIFEGLFGADATGSGRHNDPVELALARIRQLAAHEVGHTLGIAHNFSASAEGRASVMDYPAPLIEVNAEGNLTGAQAYAVGIGSWDKYVIQAMYLEFMEDRGVSVLDGRVERNPVRLVMDEGAQYPRSTFASDSDTRPAGAAHPLACLWDNGEDPIAELGRVMNVRSVALENFGVDRIPKGASTAGLEEVFLPLYFWHRYQVVAAAKSIGGLSYGPQRRRDPYLWHLPERVDAAAQARALEALAATLDYEALDVPLIVARGLPPRTLVQGRRREVFSGRTAPMLDTLGLAEASARLTVRALLQPQRLGRVVDQHTLDPAQLSIENIFEALAVHFARSERIVDPRAHELRDVVCDVIVDETLRLARDGSASPRVRAEAEAALRLFRGKLRAVAPTDAVDIALVLRIQRFAERASDEGAPPSSARELPPGSPIGSAARASGEYDLPLGPGWGACSVGSDNSLGSE